MNDKIVTLYKCNFTEADWFKLSLAFDFDQEEVTADIHIIVE